jgi:N-acetylneuraminic acid mutarotase
MKHRIHGLLSSFSPALAGLALIFLSAHPAQAASWIANNPLHIARHGHTATLLPNGKVIVVGGRDSNDVSLGSAELYDPATGTWTTTGSLNIARYDHTATLLPNGKLLVVGGIGSHAVSVVEQYDPTTGVWTTNSLTLNTARFRHTATLLANGKVLVAGGGNGGFLSSAEVFDPATGTWTPTVNSLAAGRVLHTATLLGNGKVLIAGGAGTNAGSPGIVSSAELYDPASGMWAAVNPMHLGRYRHTATLLPNGQLMVAGGAAVGSVTNSAEVYDPVAGTWTTINSMKRARFYQTASLLPNGTVLVTGGDGVGNAAEIYDSSNGTWTTTNTMNNVRQSHTATMLANGKVLVTGGTDLYYNPTASTEIYDPDINPAMGTNKLTGALISRRADHQSILLPNGKVLVAGGEGGNFSSSAELFRPTNGTWTLSGQMTRERGWGVTLTLLPDGSVLAKGGINYSGFPFPYDSELYDSATGNWTGISPPESDLRVSHSATLLPNGKVLVAGGLNQGFGVSCFASAGLYDPGSKTWSPAGPMRSPRWGHVAVLLPTGKVLVAGGATNFNWNQYVPIGITNSAELYDPVLGTWTNTAAMNTARIGHTAILLPNGKVLVAGGDLGITNIFLASAELYDPIAGTWTNTGAMNVARGNHSAILLPGGKVMVAGGFAGTNYFSSVELYDPAYGTWTLTTNLNFARRNHTATLLPSGKVLLAGGYNGNFASPTNVLSSAELYDPGLGYSNAWQPQITAITSPLSLGGGLVVTGAQFRGIAEGSGGNTQDSAADYPLVQLRSLESGQTTFLLTTNWSTNSVTSTAVWNFPPGWALATVFVNGIQSTSAVVNISVPAPTATTLTGMAWNNSAFGFNFTSSPGSLFGVLAATNVSLPLTNWTALGGVLEVAPGQFQFTDAQATNGGQRFYRLYSP